MSIHRVSDVKNYIKSNYPKLNEKKFDVVKIGVRTYIYLVDLQGNLQRGVVFQGNLPAINELDALKKAFESNVRNILQKWNYA
jgi:hypothetical protein